ncbi:hypothetical protein KUTeg_003522 [Tegillarca granosa]|uniref:Ras GTPase-activating protein-binding protein 2 n=1 Tax=Tegillarca granosa TaxID=220873 RepID=A0ABQ9FQJ6_TEGGR|nr:hypothetical protein KUTeg_003522 [Tegillarca granosa]
MVMETPSPQCVGREFVRQYYTLLHEAPLHLHRFYSHNSSFVHGGVEKPGEEQPPVMGQADIHKKIMSLNFRDCHAKIRQVDSQATVGSAVVVQVTGELSNNGQPMRRFMQTFVLAPQSPKKYYVHNDIFRYQDEVFHDSDSDVENQDEGKYNVKYMLYLLFDWLEWFYPNQDGFTYSEVENLADSPASSVQDTVPDTTYYAEPQTLRSMDYEYTPVLVLLTIVEPKPFSWAAMASKNTPNSVGQPVQTPVQSPPFGKAMPSRPEPKPDPGPAGGAPQPQRPSRAQRDRFRDRERTSMSRDGDGDSDSQNRRGSRFPDSHQLFVGNLPHNITEKELWDFFGKYGTVVELRINTKSSGGKLPVSSFKNFGFVVFESPDPVQEILGKKPIMYNGDHRLNVEEKKPRGGDGRPGSGRGGMMRGGGGGMGGPRGGGMGGRGGGMGGIRGGGGGGLGPGQRSDRGNVGVRGGVSGGPRR